MYIYSALHKFGIALGGVLDNISINQYFCPLAMQSHHKRFCADILPMVLPNFWRALCK